MDIVTLAHGSGGMNAAAFVEHVFMPYFKELMPYANEDSGIFGGESRYVTSTDSYTITPLVFAGGDIGKLCVCGSSNDVAMMGGKPLYLNIGFIIEEGFSIPLLKQIIQSIATECKKLNLIILAADTKVLPKVTQNSTQEKLLLINTTCIGSIEKEHISARNLAQDDCILLSGAIGSHGARIFLEQNNIALTNTIQSDCASLYPMLEPLLRSNIPIHAMRDATRGGLSSVLNEWAISSHACIDIEEEQISVSDEVYGVCEMLGLEPYDLANEGVCVIALPQQYAAQALEILGQHELGRNASIIGKVSQIFTPKDSHKRKQNVEFGGSAPTNYAASRADSANLVENNATSQDSQSMGSKDSEHLRSIAPKDLGHSQNTASQSLANLQNEVAQDSANLQKIMPQNAANPQSTHTANTIAQDTYYQRVVLHTRYGSKRFLEYPQGELLPRIC